MAGKQVDEWFGRYEHPLKNVMLRVREIILSTDSRMDECIKWSSPTFTFEGNLASFNPRARRHVSLMFHTGASIPGNHPSLIGGGGTARFMAFEDMSDAESKREDLRNIVRAWIKMKGGKMKVPEKATADEPVTKPAVKSAKKPPQKTVETTPKKKTAAKTAVTKTAGKKATKKKTAGKVAKKAAAKTTKKTAGKTVKKAPKKVSKKKAARKK